MNYQNKYNDFKAEIIIQLRQLLNEKGYNQEETENIIQQYLCANTNQYYKIVLWDGESFKGLGNETDSEYWFEIEELDLFTLCQIADYINEQD